VVPCALKLTAIAILCCGALVVGCGVEAPEPEGEQQALTDQGGAGGMGGESSTSSSSTGSSSTSTGTDSCIAWTWAFSKGGSFMIAGSTRARMWTSGIGRCLTGLSGQPAARERFLKKS